MIKYYLEITSGNVTLPQEINVEYDNLNNAYDALSDFIHTFDYKEQVEGRVIDEFGDDWEYDSSIM